MVKSSYVISALLCVTLDGQILYRWVFVVDVTRGISVEYYFLQGDTEIFHDIFWVYQNL